MLIESIIKFEFLRYAYISGILIAIFLPILSSFLIIRRQAYFSDTIAHVSLAGVSFSSIVPIAFGLIVSPTVLALLFAVIGAMLIEYFRSNFQGFKELSMMIVMSFSIAIAIAISSVTNSFSNLSAYLFGSINTISSGELYLIIAIFIIVIIFVYANYYKLLGLCIDEKYFKLRNSKHLLLRYTFIIITALAIAVSIKIIGALLISTLMVIPATISINHAKSFRVSQFRAVLFSLLSVIVGLIISFYINIPSGAAIAIVLCILFVISKFRRRVI